MQRSDDLAQQTAIGMLDHPRPDSARHAALQALVETADKQGYAFLEPGLIRGISQAVEFSHRVLQAKRRKHRTDPRPFSGADLLAASRYEEAPEFFDLALSDELLEIAAAYMGQVPVLAKPRLWWTTPDAGKPGGTQLFHIGARVRPVVARQAKFLFLMSDVDETCGPFTFLPLNITQEIVNAIDYQMGEEVPDEVIFRYARSSDLRTFTGKAGSGIFVDTSRCFHYGRRAQTRERLMLMIQYKLSHQVPVGDRVTRSPGFQKKYAHDPLRAQVMPNF